MANAANTLGATITPGMVNSIGPGRLRNGGRDGSSVAGNGDCVYANPLGMVEVNHLMLRLVVHRLGAVVEARVAEIKVVANRALVTSSNNGLVACVTVGSMNHGRGYG